jgi:hypothetical protein
MNETSFDEFAWKLANSLVEDFSQLRHVCGDAAYECLRTRHVAKTRALHLRQEGMSPYQVKMAYQLESLFKKFSFSKDLHTPEDLQRDSIKKFMDNQDRLLKFSLPEDDALIKHVIFGARGYVDQVLGDRDHLEICANATFGKKSSVGVAMRKACEGARYEPPITGSRPHIDWFEHYYGVYNRPAYLYAKSRSAVKRREMYREVNELDAVLVDKTWKSLRMIMPNTTLGTLYSGGLGKVIESRLRNSGYDIRTLQPIHRGLAQEASLTGKYVTADQSLASDNITVALIRALFPRPWAAALEYGRIETISLYGATVHTPTFSTMGIGFTFPLQTLVFLAVLSGIRSYLGDETLLISAYGDDLIYSKEMHDLVTEVFPKLGLILNQEKTFSDGWFRESCGGDYFRGLDVRPYLLGRADGSTIKGRAGEAYLYKAFNGLTARWSLDEVPSAVQLILSELDKVKRGVPPYVVPNDFPDTAGLKALSWPLREYDVHRKDKNGLRRFPYLAFTASKQEEKRETPYLFLALRGGGRPMDIPLNNFPPRFARLWREGHGFLVDDEPQKLTEFKERVDPVKNRRSFVTKRGIPAQDAGYYREQLGFTLE